MAYAHRVPGFPKIVEMPAYTRRLTSLLGEEDYRQLQLALLETPTLGRVIQGTGGLRKVRWASQGRGKRGGVRVIYYWARARGEVLMLFIYGKDEQDDLTPDQRKQLKKALEAEYP
jgi:mRNA-degrading endonuclease RelE of RelBE toxin-antitoxin system